MKLNTFQIIVLVAFGFLALFGLFMFANFNGSGSDVKVGRVVIWGSLPKAAIEAGIQELVAAEEEYSEVSYVEVPFSSFSRELADALAEGSGPDLVILSQEELLTERGKLYPIPYESLSERSFVDSFVPAFELFLSPEGAYGIPLVIDPLVLYYNRAILSSAGVATPPSTWEAVLGLAPSITRRDQGGALTRSLIPFGSYGNVTNARAILSLLFLQGGTPITLEDERGVHAALEEEALGRSGAEAAVSYFAQFGDPAKLVYSWNQAQPSSRTAFLSGDLALYPGFASELPGLMNAAPNLDFDMARIPEPATASSHITYGRAYVLALTKASGNVHGALSVAYALSSGSSGYAVAKTLNAAPARRSLLKAPANDRYAELYYPEALTARGWLSPSPSATDVIFSAMIGNMTTGRQDVADAVSAAGQALDAALR